ncbi:MAG: TonB C-terminal domain-containing protein [Myxococcales bacterium]|nr:TonB C-terminal domain-containing protein [Myxococcales bacterium]
MPARSLPALLTPFAALARECTDLVRNRVAFAGGLVGSTVCMAGAAALALHGGDADASTNVDDDDELDVVFLAGVVARKGSEPVLDLEKTLVDAQRAVDPPPPPANNVTTDANLPTPPPPPPDPEPTVKPKPSRDPVDPNQQGKPSDHNSDGNNPYHDPTTADELPGDPFGSPDGWSDMARDGDPWATAVLTALNNLTVGSYAGLGQDVTYKFQIVVCADGRIDAVRQKQSTGKPDFDGQIRGAIERIKLPKAPPELARQLAGKCKKIPYEFTWSGKQRRVQ